MSRSDRDKALREDSMAATKALMGAESNIAYSDFFRRSVRVRRVGRNITADFHTISDAIAASEPFDRIEIDGGDYYEAIAIPHSLELVSSDNGEDAHIRTRGPCITVATEDPVLISRLRVSGRGQRSADCVALMIVRGSPIVKDCLLTAVHVAGYATPTITHCAIEESESGCGLRLADHCGGEYSYNDIRFHRNECVKISCAGKPLFLKNRIYQRHAMMSIVSIAGGRYGVECAPIFQENMISGSANMSAEMEEGNLFERPLQLLEHDFSVPDALISVTWGASPRIFKNSLTRGNSVGIQLGESVIFEDQVIENRIMGCASWGMFLGRRSVAKIGANDIHRCGGGIRVQSANAVVERCSLSQNQYYGLMVYNSSPLISRCVMDRNQCGVAVLKDCTGMRLEENTIRHNTVCGIEIVQRGTATIVGNSINYNAGVGCLVSDGSSVTLERNVLKENDTNVQVRGQSYVHCVRNEFLRPTGHSLILQEESDGLIESNDFCEAQLLAQISVVERSLGTIRNNTIRAGGSSGILIETNAKPVIFENQFASQREAIRSRLKGQPVAYANDIQTCSHGLVCEEEGTCLFTRNYIKSCSFSFVTSRSAGHPSVRDNECTTSARFGFVIEEGGKGDFEKNFVKDCAIGLVVIKGRWSDALVSKNTFDRSSGFGIFVQNFAKGSIRGNIISGIETFAMGCGEEGEGSFTRNVVYSSLGVGIYSTAGGYFSENTIQGCRIAGINVAANSTSKFVKNHIRGGPTDGILISEKARSIFLEDTVEMNGGHGVVVEGDAPSVELQKLTIRKNEHNGVLVREHGSCCFDGCTIEENNGEGVHSNGGGDTLFVDCTIRRHKRCVSSRSGGQVVFEHCKIEEATEECLVLVFLGGMLSLKGCALRMSERHGVSLTCGGKVLLDGTTIADCNGGGVAATADACATVIGGEVIDCNFGVILQPRTSMLEYRHYMTSNFMGQQGLPAANKRSGEGSATRGRRRSSNTSSPEIRMSSLSPTKRKPAQPTTGKVVTQEPFTVLSPLNNAIASPAKNPLSPLVENVLSANSHTIEVPPLDDALVLSATLSPTHNSTSDLAVEIDELFLYEPITIPASSFTETKITNTVDSGVVCYPEARGSVERCVIELCGSGLCLHRDSLSTCRNNIIRKSSGAGLLIEGTPHLDTVIESNTFEMGQTLGAVLRGVGISCVLKHCTFRENGGGGIMTTTGAAHFISCVIEKQDTFGVWCGDKDRSHFKACTMEANKENNVVILGKASPVLHDCIIKNSEHGISILEGSTATCKVSSIIMNRIGVVVYKDAESLDNPVTPMDTQWNERFRAGAPRKKSSVAVYQKYWEREGSRRFSTVNTTYLTNGTVLGLGGFGGGGGDTSRHHSMSINNNTRKGSSLGDSYAFPAGGRKQSSLAAQGVVSPQQQASTSLSIREDSTEIMFDECTFESDSIGIEFNALDTELNVVGGRFQHCSHQGASIGSRTTAKVTSAFFSGAMHGLVIQSYARATVSRTRFHMNRVGVTVDGNTESSIQSCEFSDNSDTGLLIRNRVLAVAVSENKFSRNGRQGIDIGFSSHVSIGNNVLVDERCGIKVHDASCPILHHNTFHGCTEAGVEVTGVKCNPKILLNTFHLNKQGCLCDEKSSPDVYRNEFVNSGYAGVCSMHHADPNIVQNFFEQHGKDSCGVRVLLNGTGVVGMNRFAGNYDGIHVGTNLDSFVAMLNVFEKHTNAAACFTASSAGFFTRNRCSGNLRNDVLIAESPANFGLYIEKNAFLVGGTGVRVEGSCVNKCIVRRNRFAGLSGCGTGIATYSGGTPHVTENLFTNMGCGIIFGSGGLGLVEQCLISNCQQGMQAATSSEGVMKDCTIVSSVGHGVLCEEGSKIHLSLSRIGQTLSPKPCLLLKGEGDVSLNLLFSSATIVQFGENASLVFSKNTVKEGKTGVVLGAFSRATIKSNAIQRNDNGVVIQQSAAGVFNANSVFANFKSALQVNVPHSVAITQNYVAQDNDCTPIVGTLSNADVAALGKANNVTSGSGKGEGNGERHIVPQVVSKALAKESTLVQQFHEFLNQLMVPPTDGSIAAMSGMAGVAMEPMAQAEAEEAIMEGSMVAASPKESAKPPGFSFQMFLQPSFLSKAGVISASVEDAERRISEVATRSNVALFPDREDEDDVLLKKFSQANWDVSRIVSRKGGNGSVAGGGGGGGNGLPHDLEDDVDSNDSSFVSCSGSDSEWEYELLPDGSRRKRRKKKKDRKSNKERTAASNRAKQRRKLQKEAEMIRKRKEEEQQALAAQKLAHEAELKRILEETIAEEERQRKERLEREKRSTALVTVIPDDDDDPPAPAAALGPPKPSFASNLLSTMSLPGSEKLRQLAKIASSVSAILTAKKSNLSTATTVADTEPEKPREKSTSRRSRRKSSRSFGKIVRQESEGSSSSSSSEVGVRKAKSPKRKSTKSRITRSSVTASSVNDDEEEKVRQRALPKAFKSNANFMKPIEREVTPVPEYVPPPRADYVPPPPPKPVEKSIDERRKTAVERLNKYQAVWLLLGKKKKSENSDDSADDLGFDDSTVPIIGAANPFRKWRAASDVEGGAGVEGDGTDGAESENRAGRRPFESYGGEDDEEDWSEDGNNIVGTTEDGEVISGQRLSRYAAKSDVKAVVLLPHILSGGTARKDMKGSFFNALMRSKSQTAQGGGVTPKGMNLTAESSNGPFSSGGYPAGGSPLTPHRSGRRVSMSGIDKDDGTSYGEGTSADFAPIIFANRSDNEEEGNTTPSALNIIKDLVVKRKYYQMLASKPKILAQDMIDALFENMTRGSKLMMLDGSGLAEERVSSPVGSPKGHWSTSGVSFTLSGSPLRASHDTPTGTPTVGQKVSVEWNRNVRKTRQRIMDIIQHGKAQYHRPSIQASASTPGDGNISILGRSASLLTSPTLCVDAPDEEDTLSRNGVEGAIRAAIRSLGKKSKPRVRNPLDSAEMQELTGPSCIVLKRSHSPLLKLCDDESAAVFLPSLRLVVDGTSSRGARDEAPSRETLSLPPATSVSGIVTVVTTSPRLPPQTPDRPSTRNYIKVIREEPQFCIGTPNLVAAKVPAASARSSVVPHPPKVSPSTPAEGYRLRKGRTSSQTPVGSSVSPLPILLKSPSTPFDVAKPKETSPFVNRIVPIPYQLVDVDAMEIGCASNAPEAIVRAPS